MTHLVCTTCGQTTPADTQRWDCPCGSPLDLSFTPAADPTTAAGPATMWRYREMLPVARDADIVTLGEGCTPVLPLTIDGRTILVKQEQLSPTGSFKDRGASVLISHVKSLGIDHVVEDSSGNAGAAIAAYCARAGIACDIYVPQSTSAAKVVQIERYSARLVRVPGAREAAADTARSAARETYYASHCWNPFFFHGTKTFAYELCEQLGWRTPDAVVLPVGNGTLLLGAAIGFRELRDAGIVTRLPRLIGVQTAACAPLATASGRGESAPAEFVASPSVAEGIAVGRPIRGVQILSAVRETDGMILAVHENEIVGAMTLAHHAGFFVEPTAAVALAGVRKLLPAMGADEEVVTVFTGLGFKSTDKMWAPST